MLIFAQQSSGPHPLETVNLIAIFPFSGLNLQHFSHFLFLFIDHYHRDHNEPCLPPKFYLTSVARYVDVPREIPDNISYAKLVVVVRGGEVSKAHFGLCEKGRYIYPLIMLIS